MVDFSVKRIWDKAPHNGFTDLTFFANKWYCVFREGETHVSWDGALRIIESDDGEHWRHAALISIEQADLRDPKLVVTPDNQLMLLGGFRSPGQKGFHSLVWFSPNGYEWSNPVIAAHRNMWLWRVTWHNGHCYGVGYRAKKEMVRLYESANGRKFKTLVPELFSKQLYEKGYPNESSLVFLPDNTCYCLLRRDADTGTAQLGIASPPYRDWQWKDLELEVGGPHMLQLTDGRFVVAGRLYDGKQQRTSLMWLDPVKGELKEFLTLPSGGDTSYPGLVWREGKLWVSYYSSHEEKSSIYLAQVKLPRKLKFFSKAHVQTTTADSP